jgi:hypothetical protein
MVDEISDKIGLIFKDMQRFLSSLAKMVMDHQLALDFFLTEKGGVCTIANTSYCTYINTSGTMEECADYILQHVKWLQEQSLKYRSPHSSPHRYGDKLNPGYPQ